MVRIHCRRGTGGGEEAWECSNKAAARHRECIVGPGAQEASSSVQKQLTLKHINF